MILTFTHFSLGLFELLASIYYLNWYNFFKIVLTNEEGIACNKLVLYGSPDPYEAR